MILVYYRSKSRTFTYRPNAFSSLHEHIFSMCCLYRLNCCNLTENCCTDLAIAMSSTSSHLTELDLSENSLKDSGVKLLSVGLGNPHCKLKSLRSVTYIERLKHCTIYSTSVNGTNYGCKTGGLGLLLFAVINVVEL